MPAELLRFEITESAVMGDPARATEALQRLHDHGVGLSIDDFGTGYTSMAYLRRLPIDELKVDRSFVMSMTENEHDAVLVRTAIDLGHNLGLTVVAEGVEQAAHVSALRALDCDVVQGYHYARPMPAADSPRCSSARSSPSSSPGLRAEDRRRCTGQKAGEPHRVSRAGRRSPRCSLAAAPDCMGLRASVPVVALTVVRMHDGRATHPIEGDEPISDAQVMRIARVVEFRVHTLPGS